MPLTAISAHSIQVSLIRGLDFRISAANMSWLMCLPAQLLSPPEVGVIAVDTVLLNALPDDRILHRAHGMRPCQRHPLAGLAPQRYRDRGQHPRRPALHGFVPPLCSHKPYRTVLPALYKPCFPCLLPKVDPHKASFRSLQGQAYILARPQRTHPWEIK